MAVEALPPTPQTTLAILLGASEWPYFSTFQPSEAFTKAVKGFKAYLLAPQRFALPPENLLDLFNSPKSADELDEDIGYFLEQRSAVLKAAGDAPRDVLLYFVGHGGFVGRDSDFYLAIQRTRIENPRVSGIQMTALADTLLDKARHLRHLIILDCCFAAAAFIAFQADPAQIAIVKTIDAFEVKKKAEGLPRKGTALLCSSDQKTPSLLLPDHSSTMFSAALVAALSMRNILQQEHLSLRDIRDLTADILWDMPTGNAPRPVVHSPDQSEGDVADVPFFPNFAQVASSPGTSLGEEGSSTPHRAFPIDGQMLQPIPPDSGYIPSDRTHLAERIQAFNQGRDPRLLRLKYRVMLTDVFAFFRGTCHLFYEDWPTDSTLNEAPPTWICGDLHMQNFASYKGNDQLVHFNIRFFGESALAPCTWDLARYLVSVLVIARTIRINKTKSLMLCAHFLNSYTEALVKGNIRQVDEENAVGPVKDLLFKVKKRQRKDLLDRWTERRGEVRKLLIDEKRTTAVTVTERVEIITLLKNWGEKFSDPQFFKVLDVAHRTAGISSLGVERYIVLVEGKGSPNQNYLFEVEGVFPSCLQPYLKLTQPQWANEAERVVSLQRWIQGIPPALLTAVEHDGKFYILRELQPVLDTVYVRDIKWRQMEELTNTIAKVVAWGQLRSSGYQASADAYALMSFAQASHWQDVLLSYVQSYATQVGADYQAFVSAYQRGIFSSEPG